MSDRNVAVSASVDALFVDPKGPYPRLLGPEHCWDEKRDARTYTGPGPVVAHPPCAAWCQLAGAREGRYGYPRGQDGGLFLFALSELLRCGGVLEHPAYSKAWDAYGLPKPERGRWREWNRGRNERIWVCEVSQCAYGHRARKRTWLVYCGARPPFELDWSEPPYTHKIGHDSRMKRPRPGLGKREACATPDAFAAVLIALARHAAP